MILKYIPNALTLFRLILIAPFLFYLSTNEYPKAFYIFILAGLTDCLDGWLARHFNWQSFFGSFVDPLADKVLVASSFISLGLLGLLPWWLVILVFLRDVSIFMGILSWYCLIRRRLDFEPTRLSKFNTLLQLFLVTVCLFELAYFKYSPYLIKTLIYLTALTTLVTYAQYLWLGYHKAWSKKEWV